MKIFVLGYAHLQCERLLHNSCIWSSATGFIGLPTAQALARAGHIVHGLARTEEKAKALAAEESTCLACVE
jgi:nucleoside-diphosphate-sugar epimerase